MEVLNGVVFEADEFEVGLDPALLMMVVTIRTVGEIPSSSCFGYGWPCIICHRTCYCVAGTNTVRRMT